MDILWMTQNRFYYLPMFTQVMAWCCEHRGEQWDTQVWEHLWFELIRFKKTPRGVLSSYTSQSLIYNVMSCINWPYESKHRYNLVIYKKNMTSILGSIANPYVIFRSFPVKHIYFLQINVIYICKQFSCPYFTPPVAHSCDICNKHMLCQLCISAYTLHGDLKIYLS